MNVYQTRRTACHPQEAYDLIKAQSTKIELQGFGYTGGFSLRAVPDPEERRRGDLEPHAALPRRWCQRASTTASRCARNGDFYKIATEEKRVFFRNLDTAPDNLLGVYSARFLAPATLEGTVFLVHEPIDQVKQSRSAWIYNAGQRRVRRAPDLAYDNINDGTEGLRTTDQFDAYNGAPDRYDWKLVGKKEMLHPVQLLQAVRQEAQVREGHHPARTPSTRT